jgi:uncharacterized cupredoxin-like copper-binding protein
MGWGNENFRMRGRLTFCATVLTAAALAAGCGEDREDDTGTTGTVTTGTQAETTPAPTGAPTATVKATLGEFFIRTDRKAVDAGTIRFEVANEGKIEHEFEVVRTNEAPGSFPITDENKADVEAVGEELGEIPPIASGGSDELTLELEPGKLVFICNLPEHYGSGQRLGFTVR